MQMLYNSDSFAVVSFDVPADEGEGALTRGGYEIVDKFARKEIFIQGALAESFKQGVQALGEPHAAGVDAHQGGVGRDLGAHRLGQGGDELFGVRELHVWHFQSTGAG